MINVKKNKYLLSPIDHNACLYYLIKGLVRGFIKVGKKDITTWFSFGNEIIGAFRNPDGNAKHSTEYIQALEDAELICIPYKLIDFLYENFAEANIIGRKMLAHQYYLASERAILARIPMATERYREFEENSKVELSRIPLRYMATYLGMRLETLSRIRNKLTPTRLVS
ncbi:Crp/Fnr family transcriptional regulator [Pedobacter kyonggii]|uniref:Crp/Fnr family transcriptional regulator n=1 Tax=Pedobacter kyonggii TaxID=1926871 RepID=A0A4Q9HCJ0_9SPHI|nr:Crp/Fnr family transcriptional regulator [Pedobacter kyonggii]TBO41719.1 Crp/Fnr family transcriptional regulator [Pedobacter kyonggii]